MNAHGGASDFSVETTVRCGAGGSAGGRSVSGQIMPELLKLTHDALS